MTNVCPSCQKGCLSPIIRSQPFMIVKEQCTQNEMEQEAVFTISGKNKYNHAENTTSYYLQKELGMVGLQMNIFSLTNLYMHVPPSRKKTKEERAIVTGCADFSIAEVIRIAKGMKIVLLMGAEVVRTFTGYGISDVSGLLVKSDYLPNVPVIIPANNPDKILNQPIGELRSSLAVLAEQVAVYKDYVRGE